MSKSKSFYNRNAPLLERKHVPCELILYPKDAKSGSGNNSFSKGKVFFTLRVLQGHRSISDSAATERAIRLELSDEYRKIGTQRKTHKQSNRRSPHGDGSSSSLNQNRQSHGPIHFPAFQQDDKTISFPSVQSHSREKAQDESYADIDDTTVDASPIQLYELELGESDFAQLRQDQALLVDFNNFSDSFIELLMACDLGESDQKLDDEDCRMNIPPCQKNVPNPLIGCQISSNSGAISGHGLSMTSQNSKAPGSQFSCRIEDFSEQSTNSWSANKSEALIARFSIVESNQFRELVHLSLNIQPGTDATIRSYLSGRLHEAIGQTAMLKFQLHSEKERANSTERTYNDISQQYNELAKMSERERNSLAQEADESIQKENTKRCQELQVIRRLNEEEIQSLRGAMEDQRRALQSQIDALEEENGQLSSHNVEKDRALSNLELCFNKCEFSLESKKVEAAGLHEELRSVKDERTNLEHGLKQCQSFTSKLEVSNEQYEQRLIESQHKLKEATNDALEAQQESETYSIELHTMQQELCTTKEECCKSSDLLGRYQRDRQEMKRRMKSKVEMIQKQEEILASREIGSTDTQEKLMERENACHKLEHELALVKQQLAESQQSLDENKKTLSSNQQVRTLGNKCCLYL